MPRSAASARPIASLRLLMTAMTSPSILPSPTASSIALMFDPRPEIRITSRFMIAGPLDNDRARRAGVLLLDRTDEVGPFAKSREPIYRCLRCCGIDHQHQTDAAVEYAVHLGAGDLARTLQPVEDRRPRPAGRVDARGEPGSEHAVRVLAQAAACDVCHALDLGLRQECQHRLDVDARRREQGFAERRAAGDAFDGAPQIRARGFDDAAD